MSSRPIDTPERRAAIHGSPEVAAAKHLARAYGFSMRRHRRQGYVAYDIGLGGTTRATYAMFGEIAFTDEGKLDFARLFGSEYGAWDAEAPLTMLALGSILENGLVPVEAESSTVVLDALPEEAVLASALTGTLELDATTGPIPILATLPTAADSTSLEVEAVPEPVIAPEVPDACDPLLDTASIPVPITITLTRPPRPRRARSALTSPPPAAPSTRPAWVSFLVGLALTLQLVAYLLAMTPPRGGLNGDWLLMSVVGATVGVILIALGIKEHDALTERSTA